jgi:hypothetical protein
MTDSRRALSRAPQHALEVPLAVALGPDDRVHDAADVEADRLQLGGHGVDEVRQVVGRRLHDAAQARVLVRVARADERRPAAAVGDQREGADDLVVHRLGIAAVAAVALEVGGGEGLQRAGTLGRLALVDVREDPVLQPLLGDRHPITTTLHRIR